MRPSLLAQMLARPDQLSGCLPADWDLLIRQARQSNMLGQLACVADATGVVVPPGPEVHLAGARAVAKRLADETFFELAYLSKVVQGLGVPVVLLKGAAYLAAGLPVGRGRYFSDIDILVPRPALELLESALLAAGWMGSKTGAYDQHYYRTWMHELPPMRHMRRGSVVDVHHAILPQTSRLKPDTTQLLNLLRPLPGFPGLFVLAPEDLVLHSAAHLFHEGEFSSGLRGLYDLYAMMAAFAQEDVLFGTLLESRAAVLDLEWPLLYALRFARSQFGLVYPEGMEARLARSPRVGKREWQLRCLDLLFDVAWAPDYTKRKDFKSWLKKQVLYLRGHLLRMPLHLLLPHLLRKAWMGWREKKINV